MKGGVAMAGNGGGNAMAVAAAQQGAIRVFTLFADSCATAFRASADKFVASGVVDM